MRRSTHTVIVAGMLAACLAPMAQAGGNSSMTLRTRLFSDGRVSARVYYQDKDQGEKGIERRFKVHLKSADPGEPFDVYINRDLVATMTADEHGRAKLSFRTARFIINPEVDDPMPLDFPEVQSGDFIAVGMIAGIFFDGGGGARAQRYRLRGELESDPAVEGNVKYLERYQNGKLLRRFRVEVADAEPGEVFEVFVNGMFAGEIVIDDDDEGSLELRTASFIRAGGDGLPMPASFPTLIPGDIVEVGPLSTVVTRR